MNTIFDYARRQHRAPFKVRLSRKLLRWQAALAGGEFRQFPALGEHSSSIWRDGVRYTFSAVREEDQ